MEHELRKTLRSTARKHLDAYCKGKLWDANAIQELRTRDCEHYLGPVSSLDAQFHGNIDEDKHRNFMAFFGPIFTKFDLNVRWEAIDTERRIVAHGLSAIMDLKAFGDEPAVDGYTAEYVWTLWMDESGTKIKRVEEMVDVQRLIDHVVPRAAKFAEFAKTQQGEQESAAC